MNVFIFAEDYYFPLIGGITTHVHGLARALIAAGCGVQVMTTCKLPPGKNLTTWNVRRIIRDGVPVIEVPVLYSPRNLLVKAQQRFRFARLAKLEMKRMNADLFHWHNIYFDPDVARYVNGSSAMVFTNHSSQFLAGIIDESQGKRLFDTFNYAHRVIAPSQELLDASRRLGYPGEFSCYIPNGVDIHRFRPDQEFKTESRAKLNIPDDGIVLFCPRRVVPKCGIIHLAKALQLVKNKHRMIVYFTGFGEMENTPDLNRFIDYEDEVRRVLSSVASNVEVRLLTQIPNEEMLVYYHAVDISILPSLVEATSISGLESMACGLPLIGSSVGGIPDLIEHNSSGILVTPADPRALAMAIDTLTEHPEMRSAMGIRARQIACDRFAWATIAQKTMEVYAEAVVAYRENGQYRAVYGS